MIKAFFFDLDGTLVNTYQADYSAYADAIREVLGISISELDFAKTHGQELYQKMQLLAPSSSKDQISDIAAAKKIHYKKYLHLTVPNKKLISFLTEYYKHNITVLVTTAKRQNAVAVLKKHDLEKYFNFFVYGDEVKNPKPDPEAYLLALQKSGVSPADVIAFEDTMSGIKAAESAKIPVVHVRTFAT